MALIINEVAVAHFAADGVSTSEVTSKFSTLIYSCIQITTIDNTDISTDVDSDCPTTISQSAQDDWNANYRTRLQARLDAAKCEFQKTIYTQIVDLLSMASSSTDSYVDISQQLTATLTSYSNADGLQFLSDVQGA